VPLAGTVVARDALKGIGAEANRRACSHRDRVTGLYPNDTWSETRHLHTASLRGGTVTAQLRRDANLITGSQTVQAESRRSPSSQTTTPPSPLRWHPRNACAGSFSSVTPTAIPAPQIRACSASLPRVPLHRSLRIAYDVTPRSHRDGRRQLHPRCFEGMVEAADGRSMLVAFARSASVGGGSSTRRWRTFPVGPAPARPCRSHTPCERPGAGSDARRLNASSVRRTCCTSQLMVPRGGRASAPR